MSTVRFEITGKTPLLMNAPTTIDPLHPIKKRMDKITTKTAKERTEEEHAELSRLEWDAALYFAPGLHDGPVVPTANIKRSISKGGFEVGKMAGSKNVTNGLIPRELYAELAYEGPRDPDELYATGRFIDRRPVKRGVMRTRPKFDQWALVAEFEVDTSIIDLVDLESYAEMAGRLGLCDGRKIGFGRFSVDMVNV